MSLTPPVTDQTDPGLPSLDTETEPWVGRFPGLGTVLVGAAGQVTVLPEDPAEGDGSTGAESDSSEEVLRMRGDALQFGWGEPLSLARRGFDLVAGSTLVDPEGHCLLLSGSGRVAGVVLALVNYGWSLLADGLAPTTWGAEDCLVAHPRTAPLVVAASRAEATGVTGPLVREDTDTVAVAVARASQEAAVKGILVVDSPSASDPRGTTILRGHERFTAAAGLVVRGALHRTGAEALGSDDWLRTHVNLARIPMAKLRVSRTPDRSELTGLLDWWGGLVGPGPRWADS